MADKRQTTSIANWDWQNFHVQHELEVGDFSCGKHVLISAGPPKLLHTSFADVLNDDVLDITTQGNASIAFPIGVTDSLSLRSDKQWRRIFEIGSDRAYQLPGHVTYTGSMARVLYHGSSLLKVLYAYYGQKMPDDAKFQKTEPNVVASTGEKIPDIYEAPGTGNLFLNLASDMYDQTMGLLLIFEDSQHEQIGSVYLEECALTGHSLSVDANSPLLVEGCGFLPNRVVPVRINKGEGLTPQGILWTKPFSSAGER